MNSNNISYSSIAILLFTVLLSSCLKETAVPIESAFAIEASEDKTAPVTIQLKNESYGADELGRISFRKREDGSGFYVIGLYSSGYGFRVLVDILERKYYEETFKCFDDFYQKKRKELKLGSDV